MYDQVQPPRDIDLAITIEVQLLPSHTIHSAGSLTTYVCHNRSIILPVTKNDLFYNNEKKKTIKEELIFLT